MSTVQSQPTTNPSQSSHPTQSQMLLSSRALIAFLRMASICFSVYLILPENGDVTGDKPFRYGVLEEPTDDDWSHNITSVVVLQAERVPELVFHQS